MNNLKTIWTDLASKYTNNDTLIEELWTEIEREYTGSERHYHNLTHLEYMADKAIKYKDNLTDPDIVLFSIFYHDIVYDSKRNDNEEKSGEVAQDRLTKLQVPNEKINTCKKQILATKNHKDHESNDTNYLVDFDLAILGETPEKYKAYGKKIRQEYSFYPDLLYNDGRKKVLQNFLDMDRIFKTDEFYNNFEQQARQNLKTEIQEL